MRLTAVQLRPVSGDIEENIRRHLRLIDVATSEGSAFVLFPELSLTGYEPKLARQLATDCDDPRLRVFQELSDERNAVIGIGCPTAACGGIRISMFFFQPRTTCKSYSKQLLHADELPYFVSGDEPIVLRMANHTLAPAICYESLQSSHAEKAAREGAGIYLASVAKSVTGVARAYAHYPRIAKQHAMMVLMANCLGSCDNFVAVGQSSVWDSQGRVLGALDDTREGVLTVDTDTERVSVVHL
jgi:predicted amidohydrolase